MGEVINRSGLAIGGVAILAALALSGCGKPEATKSAANPAVFDPAQGTGPWFICDALNAPTVLVSGRPTAAGEVTMVSRDKTGKPSSGVRKYALGAAKDEAGSVVRALSQGGAEVGYVRTLSPDALPDPGAATTPPVTEVKIGETMLSCRWLAHTSLVGVTTGRTAVVTHEADGPVYRTFEFKDAATAKPVQPDAAQRSTTPSLEIRKGEPFGEDYGFSAPGATTAYSVGSGGVTTLESRRVVSGEPFVAVQSAQVPQPAR